MLRLSKSQKKCQACGTTYIRLYQYLNHVSDIDGCGNNAENVNMLIHIQSNEVLENMYDRYVSTTVSGPPSLLKFYVEGIRLQREHEALISKHRDMCTRHEILNNNFKKEVKTRVAAEIVDLQEEVDEANGHLRTCCGTIARLVNRDCIPNAYQMKPEEITSFNVKGFGSIAPKQFEAMCSQHDFMPSIVFHRCLDLILGVVSPPMIIVTNINKRKFLVRENGIAKEESIELLMLLLKDVSEKIAKCISDVQELILQEYSILRVPFNSTGLLGDMNMDRFKETYDIEMGYNGGGDKDIIRLYEQHRKYTHLLTYLQNVYLYEGSPKFNQEVTVALSSYVRRYLDLLHATDSAVIRKCCTMHVEFTGNNVRHYL